MGGDSIFAHLHICRTNLSEGSNIMEKIWVVSKTGKPVHLVDRTVVIDGYYQHIDISQKMAENFVPIEVVKSEFVQNYCSGPDAILEILLDKNEAKKRYQKYFDAFSEDEIKKKKELEAQEKKKQAALQAALKAYEASQQQAEQESLASTKKPRVKKGTKN